MGSKLSERDGALTQDLDVTSDGSLCNVVQLRRLLNERGSRLSAERVEECRVYLRHLRDYSDASGALPTTFEPLVHEIFGELADPDGGLAEAFSWRRNVTQLAHLVDEAGLEGERREQCRFFLLYLRNLCDADGVLPASVEPLVREVFGEFADLDVQLVEVVQTDAGDEPRTRVAVLIACKNGAATIAATVRSAIDQADVFVVSDGSTDATAQEADVAGARVLVRPVSGGKPDALRAGDSEFRLSETYDYVGVLDDDTIVQPGYFAQLVDKLDADENIAVASGRIDSLWDHARRWNPFIAMRAFVYWSYQTTMKRGQSALRAVNVICGANSLFRASVFKQLIATDAPYAVDDMYWVAELARRRLGRVEYVHDARAWTMDPHRFLDWYRQTVRWSWGQFQSIRGHKLGVPIRRDPQSRLGWKFSWFDAAYLMVLIDWLGYALEPVLIVPAAFWLKEWINPLWFLAFHVGMNGAWILIAALALRKPRLVALAPVMLALDLVYRVTMLHAIVKTALKPRIDTCRWEPPPRFELAQSDDRAYAAKAA